MKKQVAIYARVSSKKQKEDETIKSQLSSLSEYACKQGYNVPEGWIFSDNGITGSILDRPALNALRDLLYEGLVDAVLVYSPDRLSRKFAFQAILEMEFQKRGVELIFINTPSATTPEEQLSMNFKAVFAEYERAQITERCKRGKLYRAKQGSISVIATAPLGYDYKRKSTTENAQYIVNNDATTVQLIFNLYVSEYYSISQICERLEKDGIRTPKGCNQWCNTTVRDILKNRTYTGVAHFGKTEACSGIPGRIYRKPNGEKSCFPKHARKERPEELWIPITVPQIIAESDFETAQIKIEQNKQRASRNTRQPSILQGLLVCGHCGGSYYKKARSSKYVYYSCGRALTKKSCCGKSVRANELDTIVWEHIVELLSNPNLLENEIRRRAAESEDSSHSKVKINEIEKQLLKLSKARDKLLDAYQEGDCITLEALKKRMKEIDSKEKTMLLEKNSLEKLLDFEKKANSFKASIEAFQRILQRTDELPIKEKQNVLRLLIEEVVITNEEVEIRHCIPCHEADSQISPLCSDGYIGLSGHIKDARD